MLVLVALVAAFLGWKYSQRNRVASATRQIQNFGGHIVHRWENPTVTMKTLVLTCPRRLRETKPRTLPDGTLESYDVFTIARSYTAFVPIKSLTATGNADEQLGILNFIGNWDILVDAVKIHENDVDEELVQHLRNLDGLRIVQVYRDIEYFRMGATDAKGYSITELEKSEKLSELNRPFQNAKTLIKKSLPKVDVIDGCHD